MCQEFINCLKQSKSVYVSAFDTECLVRNCDNSIALAMELPQPCVKPSIWFFESGSIQD